LLDQVRGKLRLLHYSLATERSYVGWITRFILFHDKRHPREMGAREIAQFLTDVAVQGNVAASTQNQAFHALLFLYQQVLEMEIGSIQALRARRPKRLPVVLSRDEVRRLLERIEGAEGVFRLLASLLYGAGLRGVTKTPDPLPSTSTLYPFTGGLDHRLTPAFLRRGRTRSFCPVNWRSRCSDWAKYALTSLAVMPAVFSATFSLMASRSSR
jgi:hypothetical protein